MVGYENVNRAQRYHRAADPVRPPGRAGPGTDAYLEMLLTER